jgi:uncharacterized protein YggE
MKKIACFILIVLFQQVAIAQSSELKGSIISSVGLGSTTAFPNASQITIALEHIKPTLREAVNENQKTADEVIKIVKKYINDSTDVKISLIATNKATRWDNKLNREVFVGFESSQKIIFTLKDLKKMQDFTEELLKTKFNKIESITYFNTESETFIKKAQELAVLDALETTKRLAKVAEVKTGKIVYIQTSKSPNDKSNRSVDSFEFEAFGKGMGGRGVSSSGQLIHYSVSVTVHTEISY